MYVVALGYVTNRDFTQALFWAKKAKQAQEEGKLDKKYDLDGLIRKIEQTIAFDAAVLGSASVQLVLDVPLIGSRFTAYSTFRQ